MLCCNYTWTLCQIFFITFLYNHSCSKKWNPVILLEVCVCVCLRDLIKFFSCLCVLCLGTFVCVLLLLFRDSGGWGIFASNKPTKQFVDRI